MRHPASQPCARWLAGRSHAFIQPASRARASCMKTLDALRSDHGWLDGWMDGGMHAPARARACIQPASRARASIMHAESGCTQIRSCTVCMPNLGGPRSLVATCMMYGRKRTIAAGSCKSVRDLTNTPRIIQFTISGLYAFSGSEVFD